MLNSDYVPPAADDEKLNSPTKTPQKPQRPIEAKNLSSSMSVLEDISSQTSEVPALEDLEDEELAGILLHIWDYSGICVIHGLSSVWAESKK